MEILITIIITVIATVLIMLVSIAIAPSKENKTEMLFENDELKRKVATLEIRVEAMLNVMDHRRKALYNLGLKDKEYR